MSLMNVCAGLVVHPVAARLLQHTWWLTQQVSGVSLAAAGIVPYCVAMERHALAISAFLHTMSKSCEDRSPGLLL